MKAEKNPAARLEKLVGVNVTCIQSLRQAFYRAAEGEPETFPNRTHILVPKEVHEKYLRMYRLSQRLADALESVLNDSEHKLIMEEAQMLGYKLPDFEQFRDEMDIYRSFLKEMRPFEGIAVATRPGYIKLPRRTAESFHHMMGYNCTMVGRIFSGTFETEYMKHFTSLRRDGFKYAGATALQETLDVLMAMAQTTAEIEKQINAGRQRTDWPNFVAK